MDLSRVAAKWNVRIEPICLLACIRLIGWLAGWLVV
jgi:hypothetical protein